MQAKYIAELFAYLPFQEVFEELTSYRGVFKAQKQGLTFTNQDNLVIGVGYGDDLDSVVQKLNYFILLTEKAPALLERCGFEPEHGEDYEGHWKKVYPCGSQILLELKGPHSKWNCQLIHTDPEMREVCQEESLDAAMKVVLDYESKINKVSKFGLKAQNDLIIIAKQQKASDCPRKATQTFISWIDDACWAEQFANIAHLLNGLNTEDWDTGTLTGILVFTHCISSELGEARNSFLERTFSTLETKHGWDSEYLSRARKRLA